jgi:hypothetical protein
MFSLTSELNFERCLLFRRSSSSVEIYNNMFRNTKTFSLSFQNDREVCSLYHYYIWTEGKTGACNKCHCILFDNVILHELMTVVCKY